MTNHTTYSIAVLPGDGIGPDVIGESLKVLKAVEGQLNGVRFELQEYSVGAGEYCAAAIRCLRQPWRR